jgi:putative Holliday junction resolvase
MNNTLGFAAERSLKFKEALESRYNMEVHLIDERLSTTEATNYLLTADVSRKKRKQVIDGVAASIILDTYLKMKGNR